MKWKFFTAIALVVPAHLSYATATDGWVVTTGSKNPEKCEVRARVVVEDERYLSVFSDFSLDVYDKSRPIANIKVNLISPPSPPFHPPQLDISPDTYYVDAEDQANDDLLLQQMLAGKRLFVRYKDFTFLLPLEGFPYAYELCASIVEGK